MITPPTHFDFVETTPQEIAFKLDTFRVIDVREPEEFDGPLGHLASAESIPVSSVARKIWHWNKTEPVLVVCRSGKRSEAVCKQLVTASFTHVTNLTGGMLAWNEGCNYTNDCCGGESL